MAMESNKDENNLDSDQKSVLVKNNKYHFYSIVVNKLMPKS
jgi:hypothetical protein